MQADDVHQTFNSIGAILIGMGTMIAVINGNFILGMIPIFMMAAVAISIWFSRNNY